ncbi:MAG: hypothetical protein ACPGO5_01425 [Patescibacteria group bacterium]
MKTYIGRNDYKYRKNRRKYRKKRRGSKRRSSSKKIQMLKVPLFTLDLFKFKYHWGFWYLFLFFGSSFGDVIKSYAARSSNPFGDVASYVLFVIATLAINSYKDQLHALGARFVPALIQLYTHFIVAWVGYIFMGYGFELAYEITFSIDAFFELDFLTKTQWIAGCIVFPMLAYDMGEAIAKKNRKGQ